MQIYTDPGQPNADTKGRTVHEVKIELDAFGDGTQGVVLYVNEHRHGALLVTVAHGDPEYRGEDRRRKVAILLVDPMPYPTAEGTK